MSFKTVPLNITGPSYQSRSKPLSSQRTVNWYQQLSDGGKEKYVLLPFPGLKELGSSVEQVDRGFWRMAETLYQVKGTTLYRIDSRGTHTDLGTITGIERCIMADDGINLFIVSDLKVWHFNSDNDSITQVTDAAITGAISVDFINNQFIYTKPDFTTISDVGNGASANSLNQIGAETKPDALVRDFVFGQTIYRMGVRTIEGWYNSGIGNPPIERLDGQIFDVGLAAKNSVAETDEAFYWLGDDNAVYRSSAGAKQRISTDAISNAIQSYSVVSDAFGYTFTLEGQNFYCLTFPSENQTFIVNESLANQGWFELSSGIFNDKYQGSSMINCYNKTIVADANNGKIYTLDLDTFTNNDETLKRERVTQAIDGKLVGASRRDRLQMSSLNIEMETGVGVIQGQGDDPKIMVEHSDDGGRTWSAGTWARVGRLGEFTLLVNYDNLDTFYSRIFRISTSDPVNYSVYSASIDLRLAGK